jgi:hypothetical protein
MLRRIISIPEGAYYRGRFRATTAWSKVCKDRTEDAVDAAEDMPSNDKSSHLFNEIRIPRGAKKTISWVVRPATK